MPGWSPGIHASANLTGRISQRGLGGYLTIDVEAAGPKPALDLAEAVAQACERMAGEMSARAATSWTSPPPRWPARRSACDRRGARWRPTRTCTATSTRPAWPDSSAPSSIDFVPPVLPDQPSLDTSLTVTLSVFLGTLLGMAAISLVAGALRDQAGM